MKVIAFYLPQFHRIPENDEWWGEGFTEWTNVKKATPLYEGHNQPRIPLNENYYNLLDSSVQKWQADLANEYGVYGFCVYQYWFQGKKLLEKPLESLLNDKSINTRFCVCWANESWTNAWEGSDFKVLIEPGKKSIEDWENHFQYMLPFFKDSRYIYQDGKPVFVIYKPALVDDLEGFIKYWNKRAIESGLEGICFMYQHHSYYFCGDRKDLFDYGIEYQPGFAQLSLDTGLKKKLQKVRLAVGEFLQEKMNGIHISTSRSVGKVSYERLWDRILTFSHDKEKMIPCGFVDWDNTPRHSERGWVAEGANPNTFRVNFAKLVKKAKEEYPTDMIFMFAWNEWAEGGYLEPDTKNGYGYLEAIKESLN